MTLEIVIPQTDTRDKTTKDMTFSILAEGEPKTLTKIHRSIKKIYGVTVSFQAVLKAVNALLDQKVLIKQGKIYTINQDWILETRNYFDKLYTDFFKVKRPAKRVELGKDITIYTVHNLLELDRLWNDLLTNWAKNEKINKINCWKGRHAWWLLPRLQEEDLLHDFMLKHEIKTYNVWTSNKPLDKIATNYYANKNEKIKILKQNTKDIHIAAFGDFFIKFEIPNHLSEKLEMIYLKTKNLPDLDIKKIIDIFKENTEIELTVIKDKLIAEKISEQIMSYFK